MLEDIVAGMDLLARIKFTVCVGESWELVNTNQQISVESPTGYAHHTLNAVAL